MQKTSTLENFQRVRGMLRLLAQAPPGTVALRSDPDEVLLEL
jgi:hypothetical protein